MKCFKVIYECKSTNLCVVLSLKVYVHVLVLMILQCWVKENNVLAIVFRDNLHQPQYVEKLDKLVRFCIKEKVLSLQDLDRIWAAQDGKHEIIVKNIHDLLVKLAWDFSPEQLDHLFGCFQVRWRGTCDGICCLNSHACLLVLFLH